MPIALPPPYAEAVSDPQTPPSFGLSHLALFVARDRYDATLRFYREAMGMRIDWQPDDAAVYLSSGRDNLALHRVDRVDRSSPALDHLGFMVPDGTSVELWHRRLAGLSDELGFEILGAPRLHRDGATSFYLLDPAGNRVQIVHIPSVTG